MPRRSRARPGARLPGARDGRDGRVEQRRARRGGLRRGGRLSGGRALRGRHARRARPGARAGARAAARDRARRRRAVGAARVAPAAVGARLRGTVARARAARAAFRVGPVCRASELQPRDGAAVRPHAGGRAGAALHPVRDDNPRRAHAGRRALHAAHHGGVDGVLRRDRRRVHAAVRDVVDGRLVDVRQLSGAAARRCHVRRGACVPALRVAWRSARGHARRDSRVPAVDADARGAGAMNQESAFRDARPARVTDTPFSFLLKS
ncbi:protein of unknown function [Burkholderia multivorans]